MNLRPTTSATYDLVARGILQNQRKLLAAQEQIATGKRILRPSDDPQGTSRSLSMRRQLSEIARFRGVIERSLPSMQTATSALEESSSAIAQARALLVQGMNGTLSDEDRKSLGSSIELVGEQLLGLANTRFGDRYVFGGDRAQQPPFEGSGADVKYVGGSSSPSVLIGHGARAAIGLPGSALFQQSDLKGIGLVGDTGLALGKSAGQGSGYASLELRHDATVGTPGSGLALASGGASDTILGERVLSVDAAAGTVQLGNGPAVALPPAGGGEVLVLEDEHGAVVHLDTSGYDGSSSAVTLTGEGSISLDGAPFEALDLGAEDLRLVGSDPDVILHLDATGVRRAGSELVTFQGHSSVFDVLAAIAGDLQQPGELGTAELLPRLQAFLGELDSHQGRLLEGLGVLGGRQASLQDTQDRLAGVELQMQGLLSSVEDADLTEVVLAAGRAEQTLELVQMAGARLIQSSLLNFLR